MVQFAIIYQLLNYMLNITKQTSELNPLNAKFILHFNDKGKSVFSLSNSVDGIRRNSYNSLIQIKCIGELRIKKEGMNDDENLPGHPGSWRILL